VGQNLSRKEEPVKRKIHAGGSSKPPKGDFNSKQRKLELLKKIFYWVRAPEGG